MEEGTETTSWVGRRGTLVSLKNCPCRKQVALTDFLIQPFTAVVRMEQEKPERIDDLPS